MWLCVFDQPAVCGEPVIGEGNSFIELDIDDGSGTEEAFFPVKTQQISSPAK